MTQSNITSAAEQSPAHTPASENPRLRLYIARSTPNSVRAEFNLATVLQVIEGGAFSAFLEVIDVFSEPKRAITDGVVVTPTLICIASGRRAMLMGDLADLGLLQRTLQDVLNS